MTASEQQPNDTLLSLFFNSLTDLVDCEVPLTLCNCDAFSSFVKENCKENHQGDTDSEYHIQLDEQAAWRCYAGASRRSIIIVFIPATIDDVGKVEIQNLRKPFEMEEAEDASVKTGTTNFETMGSRKESTKTREELGPFGEEDDDAAENDSVRELRNSVSYLGTTKPPTPRQRPYFPVFIYECKFSTISDIQSKPGVAQCSLVDYTSKLDAYHAEDSTNDKSRLLSEEVSERSTELSAFCKTLSDRFFQTFVNGVFKNLQLGFALNSYDVESSVEMICEESCLEIDITSFIRVICMHFKKEQMDDEVFESVLDSNVVIKRSGKHSSGSTTKSTPRTPVTAMPKCGSETVHKFVQNSFQEILETKFSRVPENCELFYYNANEDQVRICFFAK